MPLYYPKIQGTCLARSSRFLTMDYSYIMINILTNEFDFEIANLYYKKTLCQTVIPNKSVTAIPTTTKNCNFLYGPCIRRFARYSRE